MLRSTSCTLYVIFQQTSSVAAAGTRIPHPSSVATFIGHGTVDAGFEGEVLGLRAKDT